MQLPYIARAWATSWTLDRPGHMYTQSVHPTEQQLRPSHKAVVLQAKSPAVSRSDLKSDGEGSPVGGRSLRNFITVLPLVHSLRSDPAASCRGRTTQSADPIPYGCQYRMPRPPSTLRYPRCETVECTRTPIVGADRPAHCLLRRRSWLVRCRGIAYQHSAIGLRPIILPEFEPHRGFGMADLFPPLPRIDHLFEPECNQHTEDDDADFADEFAPAVKWLGKR